MRAKTRTTKNANGLGNIYWREERQRWEGRKTVGFDKDGKQIRRTVTGKTQQEVSKKLSKVDKASSVHGLKINPTVKDWTEHWLNEICASDSTKNSTRLHKYQIMKNYVLPHIGNIKLQSLHHRDISVMLKEIQHGVKRDGTKYIRSAQTQRSALKVLRQCLSMAVRHEVIDKNYASPVYVDGIKSESSQRRAMNKSEAQILLSYVNENCHSTHQGIIHLLLSKGLRRGEVLALSWNDLDFKTRNLTIRQNLTRSPIKNNEGLIAPTEKGRILSELQIGTTKTKKSSRTVELPKEVISILKIHKQFQDETRLDFEEREQMTFGGSWSRANLIFTNEAGTPLDPDNFTSDFRRIVKSAGLIPSDGKSWTVHEMRHTCASLLIQAGVPILEISEMLGHESIKITLDIYGHLFPESRSNTANKASEILYS